MIVSNDFVRIEQRRSRVWLPLWAGEPRTAYSIIMKYTELKSTKTTSARLLSILTCTAHIAAAWYRQLCTLPPPPHQCHYLGKLVIVTGNAPVPFSTS